MVAEGRHGQSNASHLQTHEVGLPSCYNGADGRHALHNMQVFTEPHVEGEQAEVRGGPPCWRLLHHRLLPVWHGASAAAARRVPGWIRSAGRGSAAAGEAARLLPLLLPSHALRVKLRKEAVGDARRAGLPCITLVCAACLLCLLHPPPCCPYSCAVQRLHLGWQRHAHATLVVHPAGVAHDAQLGLHLIRHQIHGGILLSCPLAFGSELARLFCSGRWRQLAPSVSGLLGICTRHIYPTWRFCEVNHALACHCCSNPERGCTQGRVGAGTFKVSKCDVRLQNGEAHCFGFLRTACTELPMSSPDCSRLAFHPSVSCVTLKPPASSEGQSLLCTGPK
jgi:hypothetical protein